MLRTALKGVLAHRLRLFATALAITLGVSFMAGTLVLTDTVARTLTGLIGDVYRGTDAVVRANAAFTGGPDASAQRPRISAQLLEPLRRISGVSAAEGELLGYTRLVGKNGKPLGKTQNAAPTLGGNWMDTRELNSFTLFAGRPPRSDNEIVIDRKSARDGNLAIGDTTTVLVNGPPQKMLITGIVKFGKADSPGGASVVLFTTSAAQRFVGEPGKFDAIAFAARPGVSQEQLVRNLRSALPAGIEAVTGRQATREGQDDMTRAMSFLRTFMLIFAIVAVFVGAFMIFNTFSISVAQRTRENGLLRALGASRRQILASVLVEAMIVGLVASLVGLGLGVLVAAGLKSLLTTMGIDIPGGGLVLLGRTVVVALATGTLVTVFAAFSPARKAAKVPPIAAMRDIATTSAGYGSRQRVFVGTGLLAVGIVALFMGALGNMDNALAIVGLGAMLVFFGVATLGRTVSLPLSRVLGAPLPRMRGLVGVLARQNTTRNPKRTAATASALMISVGLIGFIAIFASSTRASISSVIDRSFSGDLTVDGGRGLAGGVDPGLAQRLNELPQVASAVGFRMGVAKVDNSVVQIGSANPDTAFHVFDVEPIRGSTELGVGDIGIHKTVSEEKHLQVGDRVRVVFKDAGTKSMRVALIYGANEFTGNYFISLASYEANFSAQRDAYVFVKKAPDASLSGALAAVQRVTDQYPGTKVVDREQFKAQVAAPVNQLLGLVYVLLILAVIIALLGIGNTLGLSIFERTREIGLLRAVGMTRSQLRSIIRWESVIIALQGVVLGLVISVLFGWVFINAVKDLGMRTVFSVPLLTLIGIAIGAAFAGVLAAVLPARRAAKIDVLRAVVSE